MHAKFKSVFAFLLTWWMVVGVFGQFEVPEALVEALHPKGFRVSIPDQEGIKLFAFHGKMNEELEGREGGFYSRDILKTKNGRWTFTDKATTVKPGDVLYYWTYVDYHDGKNKLGYTRDDQSFTFKDTPSTGAQPGETACLPTQTKTKKINTCSGKVIFEEQFAGNVASEKWEREVIFAGEPDYEYVIYTDDFKNLYVRDGMLHVRPSLTNEKYGDGFVSDRNKGLDLGAKCTGVRGTTECVQKPQLAYILPPIVSGRINTRHSFSFVYGVVEIRAKLPKGNWIYPELFLNPKNEEYGAGIESGQIRIAFLPGNQVSSKKLYGGCLLGRTIPARNFAMKSIESQKSWNDDFHVFTMKWEPESITLLVDNELYGRVYPSAGGFARKEQELNLTAAHRWRTGSVFAPFDVEMYLAIGVGVGGHSFEDSEHKTWKNNDPKAQLKFYRAKDSWYPTWNADSVLQVDYVKISAL